MADPPPRPDGAPSRADSETAPAGNRRPAGRDLNQRRSGTLVIGRLTDHGVANYQFRRDENPSYYVKVLTSRGVKVLWGKDLERALVAAETHPKNGDLVGVRRTGREAVTITARRRDPSGRVIAEEAQVAHRTRWVLEKVQFFAERARLARRVRDEQLDVRESVRAHPELKSTFLSLRAAEEYAARRIPNAEDREKFLALVREAVAGSIKKGEPLPAVRMRDQSKIQTPTPPKTSDKEGPAR